MIVNPEGDDIPTWDTFMHFEVPDDAEEQGIGRTIKQHGKRPYKEVTH